MKKRATMGDVAKAAGVSRTTVSFVLNDIADANIPDATRQRILEAARQLNYVPNSQAVNLVRGKTGVVGLVVRQSAQQMAGDPFMTEFMFGATDVLEAQGCHLLIHPDDPNAADNSYVQLIATRKVDGLILSSPLVDDQEVRLLLNEGTRFVLHGKVDVDGVVSVDVDNEAGAYRAAKHLIDLGHRRIGFISNAPFRYTSSMDRLHGYQRALADAGVAYDASLVSEGNFTDMSGTAAMQAILSAQPTAVFVGSDTVALGVMQALREAGLRVPQDVSIIGFDNLWIGRHLTPPLTTIDVPARGLGAQAARLLLALLRGDVLPSRQSTLPTRLIERASTARPK